jgi:hypothetical protein
MPQKTPPKRVAAPSKAKPKVKARSRKPVEKKRPRTVIFKSDEWYASAAMSIGIASRSKTARPERAPALESKPH